MIRRLMVFVLLLLSLFAAAPAVPAPDLHRRWLSPPNTGQGSGNGQFNYPEAWRWTARETSMWRIPIITASRSSTPTAAISPSGAVSAPETASSIPPVAWRWTARGTSMWRIPIITASRSSTPAAPIWPSGAVTAPATGSSILPGRGGGRPGERLCGGYQ